MASTSSIWSRVKARCMNWHLHRYEYPEAHRTTPPSRNGNRDTTTGASSSNNSTAASTSVFDPEELLPHRDHPLHRTSFDKLQERLGTAARFCVWTVVHGAAMYVFWVHVKPRLMEYFCGSLEEDDDNNNGGSSRSRIWNRKWKKRWSFQKKRLCCCCDTMVSENDNFCPQCGSPTFPLCVYCGAGIRNNENFCNSCGRPVADQVILDGGASMNNRPPPSAPMARRSSSMTSTHSQPQPQQQAIQRHRTGSIRQQAVIPPPYLEGSVASLSTPYSEGSSMASLPPPKQDVAEATAETVPIVQADGFVPLVTAMYVEEVTPMSAPTASAVAAVPSTTTSAEAPVQIAASPPPPPPQQPPPEQTLQVATPPPSAPSAAGSPREQSGTSQDSSTPAHAVVEGQGSKEASKQQ